ncbi:MAG: hypothetical protein AMXMBFR44_6670 [Candidatus Campbellbacteria bacterium]
MPDEKPASDGPIESLTKKLYTPGNESLTKLRRSGFHEPSYDVSEDFKHDHETPRVMKHLTKHHTKIRWFFFGAVVFFLATLSAALFFLSGDRNIVSAAKIDIAVSGPVMVAAGDTLPLAIEIRNRNTTALQISDLIIEYPEGTRSADDITVELPRQRLSLGDIGSGERVATGTRAVLFAEEGTEQTVRVTLEYRVAGSNAILAKEAEFAVRIGASPLSLSVSAPKQINSGQEVEMTVSITSNTSVLLQDVVLAADYPFGFSFKNGSPEPTFSENMWSLGDIEPEGRREIRIRGTLSGQDDEDRVFRFRTGLASERNDTQLGTAFAQVDHTISILRPFIDMRVVVNGQQDGTATIPPGGATRVDINWKNNLPTRITDAVVTARIEGDAVNERSVSALKGFYSSSNNTVTWDERSASELAVINSGESGSFSFSFSTDPITQGSTGRIDPDINLSIMITGRAVAEGGTPEQITAEEERLVRISSEIVLSGRAVHTVGPLENSGPMPPQVEEKTTYTVIWSISNAVNDVSNATVRAKLPPYMSWENEVSPSSEDVQYDSASGEIIWRAGFIRSGTGYSTPAHQVAFQVGLTPSVTQLGTSPVLVQGAVLSATDDVTQSAISAQTQYLSTALYTDPGFQPGQENVVE